MKISQREARRLRKRVEQLEDLEEQRNNAWTQAWPMGKHIGSVQLVADSFLAGAIKTSRLLNHAIVASITEQGKVNFHAMKL